MATTFPISLPKIFEDVVNNVRTAMLAELQEYDPTIVTVGYMYGNIKEVIENLAEYTKNTTKRLEKFPIIILIEDITVTRGSTNYYGTADNVNIIIANRTMPKYKSATRETKNFVPILRPLYNELLYQMANSRYIQVTHPLNIKHKVTERKYWGADDNTKSKLGDYIDAIDITGLSFDINFSYCT